MPKKIVAISGLILLSLVVVLLDLTVSNYADPDSWASSFRTGFRTQPAIAWIVGVVIGHLYHPFGQPPYASSLPAPLDVIVDPLGRWPIVRIVVAVGASTLVVALVWLIFKLAGVPLVVWPFGLVGMVFGAFMWPTSYTEDPL